MTGAVPRVEPALRAGFFAWRRKRICQIQAWPKPAKRRIIPGACIMPCLPGCRRALVFTFGSVPQGGTRAPRGLASGARTIPSLEPSQRRQEICTVTKSRSLAFGTPALNGPQCASVINPFSFLPYMPIPDFQSAMRPLLDLAKDGKEHIYRDALDSLARHFAVTAEERRILLPSGRAELFANRVGWAKTHLRMAGLIENLSRGVFRITARGMAVLNEHPKRIDLRVLQAEPVYATARARKRPERSGDRGKSVVRAEQEQRTPEEIIEDAYVTLRESLAEELLQRLKSASPDFFERLVVELLVKMGYGGTRKDAGEAIGRSGDEGIDGTIKEDRLGLDVIYIQAKRWEQTVGRPEIQKFAGALQGFRAKKGIFITTSEFSSEARQYADKIDSKIVLLDGEQVADLLIDFGLGVSGVASYEVKRVDSDYFSEEN